jgi:hypothetical protein
VGYLHAIVMLGNVYLIEILVYVSHIATFGCVHYIVAMGCVSPITTFGNFYQNTTSGYVSHIEMRGYVCHIETRGACSSHCDVRLCLSHCVEMTIFVTLGGHDYVCHITMLLCLVDWNVTMFDTLRRLEMFGTLQAWDMCVIMQCETMFITLG